MPESSTERAACQLGSATLSRLKCDIKNFSMAKRWMQSHSLHGAAAGSNLHTKKLCRTLQSLRKLNVCLWKFDMHVCAPLIPHFLPFFLIFFVCQESSQECPHIQCVSQGICATLLCCTVVLHLTWVTSHFCWSFFVVSIAVVTRPYHYCPSFFSLLLPLGNEQIMTCWKMSHITGSYCGCYCQTFVIRL